MLARQLLAVTRCTETVRRMHYELTIQSVRVRRVRPERRRIACETISLSN